jgi:hypothetical protein
MMEKRQPLQQKVLEKLDIHPQKIETRFMFITLYVSTQGGLRTLISDLRPRS